MLTYRIAESGATSAVVALSGDLDIDAAGTLGGELAPQLLEYRSVELDFSEVPFVDSSGIGQLLSLIGGIRGRGDAVVVRRVGEDVQTVFALLRLPEIVGDDVFPEMEMK